MHNQAKTQPVLLAPEPEKRKIFDNLGAGGFCYRAGFCAQQLVPFAELHQIQVPGLSVLSWVFTATHIRQPRRAGAGLSPQPMDVVSSPIRPARCINQPEAHRAHTSGGPNGCTPGLNLPGVQICFPVAQKGCCYLRSPIRWLESRLPPRTIDE